MSMSSFKADISNNVPKPNQAKKVIVLTNNNEIFNEGTSKCLALQIFGFN